MVDDFWDLEYILYNVYAHISNSYLTTILVVYLFARSCVTVDIGGCLFTVCKANNSRGLSQQR